MFKHPQVKHVISGEGGSRSHGGVTPTPVFETGLFNRSSTSPRADYRIFIVRDPRAIWLFCFGSHSEGNQMKTTTKSAAKLVVLENDDLIASETEELQERVRDRAYELSQLRGHSGREVDDWLTAESEI